MLKKSFCAKLRKNVYFIFKKKSKGRKKYHSLNDV